MKIGILHTAFIGDVILSGLLVEALFLDNHDIIYFTKKNTAPLFRSDVRIKKVIEIEKMSGLKKIKSIGKIAAQIQQENCDVLLVPHRSATSSLCASLSKVNLTIGFQNSSLAFLYKKTVPFLKEQHECIRYLSLLGPLNISTKILDDCYKLGRPILKYPSDENDKLKQKLNKMYPSLNGEKNSFFILAVGSVWKTKKYPIASWVEVVGLLLQNNPSLTCILTGGPQDKTDGELFIKLFVEKYSAQLDIEKSILNSISSFSLYEFGLLTSQAKFVLSNDSSPVHFASAFNTPIVAIFGPTITKFGFGPTSTLSLALTYQDEHKESLPCQPCSIHGKNVCPKSHFKCMKDLSPFFIFNKIQKFINPQSV